MTGARNRSLAFMLFGFVFFLQGCITIPFPFPPSEIKEVVIQDGGRDKILMLDIDGAITGGTQEGSSFFGSREDTVNRIAERLAKARNDKSVKAIILRIDSPGGGVTPSDVVYEMIRTYREETGLPIYVSMLDVAASGGYYIAMAADKIYAHPTTITGSIGVIAMFPQFENLGNKIGFSVEVVKSGENKDIGSPFRNMREEQRVIIQSVIDDMYERFIGVIEKGRPALEPETIRELADGRIYTATQAQEAGLVDGVLYLEDLVKLVREEQNLSNAKLVLYRKTVEQSYNSVYARSGVPTPMADGASRASSVNLLNVDLGEVAAPRQPVFQYLWVP